MVLVTLLWSMAGVVTRHLESAQSVEVTFWRSAANGLSLALMLSFWRGRAFWGALCRAPRIVWASGLCWSVMFTAFMLALTLTSVANVLVTMALGPMLTAILARVFLGRRLPARTWAAIGLAGLGIAWMFGAELGRGGAMLGMLVACAVPLAGATNLTLLEHAGGARQMPDMLPAVMLGAGFSAAAMLPLAWPLQAGWHDVGLLTFLGVFQLALPCLLMVWLSRALPAPEIALLALLEVLFGVLWAWLGADEVPARETLLGGGLVLLALVGNELAGARARRLQPA